MDTGLPVPEPSSQAGWALYPWEKPTVEVGVSSAA